MGAPINVHGIDHFGQIYIKREDLVRLLAVRLASCSSEFTAHDVLVQLIEELSTFGENNAKPQ